MEEASPSFPGTSVKGWVHANAPMEACRSLDLSIVPKALPVWQLLLRASVTADAFLRQSLAIGLRGRLAQDHDLLLATGCESLASSLGKPPPPTYARPQAHHSCAFPEFLERLMRRPERVSRNSKLLLYQQLCGVLLRMILRRECQPSDLISAKLGLCDCYGAGPSVPSYPAAD